MITEFKLTEQEQISAEKFYKKCKKKTKGKDVNMSYHFFPTGIGTAVKVKSETLGIEEDITDFKSWRCQTLKSIKTKVNSITDY